MELLFEDVREVVLLLEGVGDTGFLKKCVSVCFKYSVRLVVPGIVLQMGSSAKLGKTCPDFELNATTPSSDESTVAKETTVSTAFHTLCCFGN